MIVWDDSILVGIPRVDRDHKNILEYINRFIGAVEAESKTTTIHDSFREMERCIYSHLHDEEQMLSAIGYAQTEQHKLAHANLTNELAEIWDVMLADQHFLPDEAARRWLETWLFKHVKTEDFLYRDWIFGSGLEDQANHNMPD
jgi:hemerythrin